MPGPVHLRHLHRQPAAVQQAEDEHALHETVPETRGPVKDREPPPPRVLGSSRPSRASSTGKVGRGLSFHQHCLSHFKIKNELIENLCVMLKAYGGLLLCPFFFFTQPDKCDIDRSGTLQFKSVYLSLIHS